MQSEVKVSIKNLLESSPGIVSFKSLQVALDCNLSDSKRNLEQFVDCEHRYHSTLCLSGLACNPDDVVEWLIQLTDRSKIPSGKGDFVSAPDSFMYAIHKEKMTSAMLSNFDLLHSSNLTSQKRLVSVFPDSLHMDQREILPNKVPAPLEKSTSESTNKSAQTSLLQKKSVPTKRPSSRKSPIKGARGVKDKHQVNLVFSKGQANAHHCDSNKKQHDPVELDAPADPFADSEDEHQSDEDIMLSASSELSKRRRICFSSDDDDDDSDVGKQINAKKSPPKTVVNKKQKLVNKSCAKSSNGKVGDSKVQDAKRSSPARGGKKLKITESQSNSKEISASLDVKKSPQKPSLLSQKPNFQRQQVVKTFLDDDGFLITEKVWEDVEVKDVPNEVECSKAGKVEQPPDKSACKASLQKSKVCQTAKPKATKQSTLTSFLKL